MTEEESKKEVQEDANAEARKPEETADYREKYARTLAELDNLRKWSAREKEEYCAWANSGLIVKLLPVIDNFENALATGEKFHDKNFFAGMKLIYRDLMSRLEAEGLRKQDTAGRKFDPMEHECMMKVKSAECPDGNIAGELRSGYIFRNKVIRPAMVKVAVNEEAETQAEEQEKPVEHAAKTGEKAKKEQKPAEE